MFGNLEPDEDAPKASIVELCLEDRLDEITATAHMLSRATGEVAVPRLYTYVSQDARTWTCAQVDPGLVELMPEGMHSLAGRLKAAHPGAAHTVNFWVMVLGRERDGASPRERAAGISDAPSGRYMLFAGAPDGTLRHMRFVGGSWSTPAGQEKVFERLLLLTEENAQTLHFKGAVEMVEQALRLTLDAQSLEPELAPAIVDAICALNGRYLRALAEQSDTLARMVEQDALKASREKVEAVERNLRAAENSRSTLQKDFEKIQALNQSLLEQRSKAEEQLRMLRVTVPQVSAGLTRMAGKCFGERLDALF